MLKLEDVKVGMRINPDELRKFVGVAFLLTDFINHEGIVKYIGEPFSDESIKVTKEILSAGKSICTVYEPYDEEGVSYC